MRNNNHEDFGEYIWKRAINKLAWPYTDVPLYDKMGHICVCLEGFVCGGGYAMYLAKANFLPKHAIKRSLSDVKIVAGDGFVDQSMVKELGFANVVCFDDCWHITESSPHTAFGPIYYNLLKGHLCRMVDADYEEQVEDTLAAENDMLHAMPVKNGEAETNTNDFAANLNRYATYCLCSRVGNCY